MKEVLFKEKFPQLNLPDCNPRITEEEGRLMIFDSIRKKHLVLTPEEWVRQHWIYFLIEKNQYPKGLLVTERGLTYNKLQKRTDILVRNQEGAPYLLVECKAPTVPINQKTVDQAAIYHFKLKSNYLILSNGFSHIFLKYDFSKNQFLQEKNLPKAPISH
jgi:hypothetical protein